MIKKQQRWVALLVVLSFAWLLQVSALPLGAAGARDEVSSVSGDQGPDFYEAAGRKPLPPPKKSIVPYVLIGVGVVAVAAVLLLVVFKTSYDIVGEWVFEFTGPYDATSYVTFTGSKTSGSFDSDGWGGIYAVDGKNVTLTITNYSGIVFTGKFTGKNEMTGSWVEGGQTWDFVATRLSTATMAVPTPKTAAAHRAGPGASTR
jgi:hypothetical protein